MAPAVLEKYRTEFVAPECFFAPQMSFAELLSGGFIRLCPDSWPFENFSLRKIFCASFLVSLTWGRAGFLIFF